MTQTARVYGGSMYDLAVEEQIADAALKQMTQIRVLFRENPSYISLLSNPAIPKEKRSEMIDEAFADQAEKYIVNFLKLLCERGILHEFAGCCEEFTRRYNADHGISEAIVTSAVVLSDAQMDTLKEKLEKISGKKISLIQKKDAAVLGGLKVELEGKQLDGTVQGRLTGISKKLNEIIV